MENNPIVCCKQFPIKTIPIICREQSIANEELKIQIILFKLCIA